MIKLNIRWEENMLEAHRSSRKLNGTPTHDQQVLKRSMASRIKEIKKLIASGKAVVV